MGEEADRRLSKRTNTDLPVDLPGGVAARTLNISAKGAYCIVDHEIPLFTRLDLVIRIPIEQSAPPITLACTGVVVRHDVVTDDDGREQHCVAVYFERLSSRSRQALEAFIR